MIEFEHVYKSYSDTKAVLTDVSLKLETGELFTLIGSSGCGKTTLLKTINKLNTFEQGELRIDGRRVQDIGTAELSGLIGYVVQEGGLFPHLTVGENIALIMKSSHIPAEKIRERVWELLELVNLEPEIYRNKYPAQLSGGQRQRVGVARAFAMDPGIILMDEPFSALDPLTRSELQDEVVRLQKKYKKTVVFVTHDMDEAIKIATRICFLYNGRVIQCDTPENILKNPSNDYIRNFIGENRLWHNPEFIRVKDIMRKRPFTISRERTILQAMQIMRQNNIDSLLVTGEKNRFLGMIWMDSLKNVTDYDKSVSNYISDDYLSVREEDSFRNVLSMLKIRNYGHHFGIIPVLGEERELRGYLTKSSLLAVLSRQFIPEQSELEGGAAS